MNRAPLFATFGLATLLALGACNGGSGSSTASGSDSAAQAVSVTVDPAAAVVGRGAQVGFNAAVVGAALAEVKWSVVEPDGGSIDGQGVYTAPSSAGSYHILATSTVDAMATATATVTVAVAGESVTTGGGSPSSSAAALSSLPLGAFPGCQGSGCATRAGFAAGSKTYLVTSLASGTGAGTLGDCVAARGPRVCLFRVAGTIDQSLVVSNGGLTIDARSAPPGGIQITLTSNGSPAFDVKAPDVVLRGLKIRPGYDGSTPGDLSPKQAIRIVNDGGDTTRLVFDHNSIQFANATPVGLWTRDSAYRAPSEMTFSYNVIAENFWIAGNPAAYSRSWLSGCGSGGASTSRPVCAAKSAQMTNVDLHHNLLASDGYRNPEFKGLSGRLVNNYLYNWGGHGIDLVGTVSADVVGNTFRQGPLHQEMQSEGHGVNQPIELSYGGNSSDDDWAIGGCTKNCYYMTGNVDDVIQPNAASDNWSSGIATGAGLSSTYKRTSALANSSTGLALPYETAARSRTAILAPLGAGASERLDCGGAPVAQRDAVDARILAYEASGGGISTAPVNASSVTIPSIPAVSRVCSAATKDNSSAGPGGACVCADSDLDGIPDYWEKAMCGSATGCDPHGTNVASPWTNLEAYLSGLAPAP